MGAAVVGFEHYSVAAYSSTLRLKCGSVKRRPTGLKGELARDECEFRGRIEIAVDEAQK